MLGLEPRPAYTRSCFRQSQITLLILRTIMKIKLTSVFVNDQNKALDFYTKTLGFVKKADVGAGG